jgi:bla regulator protein blaR1
MTSLQLWLAPDVTRAVALAILHFLWQGLAVAALASVAMALARSAATRYAIGVAMLALMIAAPGLTFLALRQQASAPAPTALPRMANSARLAPAGSQPLEISLAETPSRNNSRLPPGNLSLLVEAWLVGVALLSLRPAAGFFILERLRHNQATPVSDALRARCLSLQQTLGVQRLIRYCESITLKAPAVVGWFRPVMFLPLSAITGLSVDQLDAVIAHELAHIKRLDAFVNLFQIATETLLFYHPAVWWLSNRVRAERENCCDDVAIAICGNAAVYARALASMAESQAAPAMAMAANRNPLTARVARILGAAKSQAGLRGASLAASALCLSLSLLAGHALFGANQTAATAATPPRPSTSAALPDLPALAQIPNNAVITVHPSPAAAPALAQPSEPSAVSEAAPEAVAVAVADQDNPSPEKAAPSSDPKGSYIDSLKAAGLPNLTIDELIDLKVQGVTADYVRSMIAAGVKPEVDEIVGMKIQGVTPEYLKTLRDLGLKLEADEALAMKIQGVTSDYVRNLRTTFPQIPADDILAMKIQGVKPEYVKGLQDASGLKIDAEESLAMKIQGVSPEYIRDLKALGLQLDSDAIIGMKVQGVTPDYAKALQAAGLHLDADTIIGMKVQGVTPDYVKALQAAGFHLDADDLIGAKVQGITPEFIELARKHGFTNLTLDKLMQLKHSGVLD